MLTSPRSWSLVIGVTCITMVTSTTGIDLNISDTSNCNVDILSSWMEQHNPWILATAEDMMVVLEEEEDVAGSNTTSTSTSNSVEIIGGPIDIKENKITPMEKSPLPAKKESSPSFQDVSNAKTKERSEPATLAVQGLGKFEFLHADEDVQVVLTSREREGADVLLLLEPLKNQSSCGVGGFLPNQVEITSEDNIVSIDNLFDPPKENVLPNLPLGDGSSRLNVGSCYYWASGYLPGDDLVEITYTPPECGCITLSVYLAFKTSNMTMIIGPDSSPALKTWLCVNPNVRNKTDSVPEYDDDEGSGHASTEDVELIEVIPLASALAAIRNVNSTDNVSLANDSNTNSTRKIMRKEERQKHRKHIRRKARQRIRHINRQMEMNSTVTSSISHRPKTRNPVVSNNRTRKARKQWRKRKQGSKVRRRKQRKQIKGKLVKNGHRKIEKQIDDSGNVTSKTNSISHEMVESSDTQIVNKSSRAEHVAVLTDTQVVSPGTPRPQIVPGIVRTSFNLSHLENSSGYMEGEDENEELDEDAAVKVFLGISDTDEEEEEQLEATRGPNREGKNIDVEEITDLQGNEDKELQGKKRRNPLNKKRKKWHKKQMKKAKKGKIGKKKVTMGERLCCKQGIQTKKLFLYLNNNKDANSTKVCAQPSREVLVWAPYKFKTSPHVCRERFNQCCNQFTLEWLDNWKQKRAARKARRKARKQHKHSHHGAGKRRQKLMARKAKIEEKWTKN